MTADVPVLPEAPGSDGVWPGWWRSSGTGTQPTVHRLVADQDRRTARTVCGRALTGPEWLSGPSRRRRIRVCSTCCTVIDRRTCLWQTQPAPSAPAGARPHAQAAPAPRAADDPAPAPAPAAPDESALVTLMAGDGYDLARHLERHRDDGSGWCRTCGGPQSGAVRAPCDQARAASRAAQVRETRARQTARPAAGVLA